MSVLLGVNVDHVATVRQARGGIHPDPLQAAWEAELGGADGITVHLREDRRHIQPHDVELLKEKIQTRLNLEMAVTDQMIAFAKKVRPAYCCFVPEKREELTTEGGLDVVNQEQKVRAACEQLAAAGSLVSLFIDPEFTQIDAAVRCGAPFIEIHTGEYALASSIEIQKKHFNRIYDAAQYAQQKGLKVNAGHGLNYHNVSAIAAIPGMIELNIGHAIVARALFCGMQRAVSEMKEIITRAVNIFVKSK